MSQTRKLALALVLLPFLAACGADGAPKPPEKPAAKPALTITGTARVGVSAEL
jgi:hypothetical protein